MADDFPISEAYLAHLSRFVTDHKQALFERILDARTRHLTVVLEDLYQTQNASACLRTCDCFGIQDVHVIENANRFRVNRDIAVGATRWLTLHRHNALPHNTLAGIEALRAAGYQIVATVPGRDSLPLDKYDITAKTALLFGTETTGLSDAALAAAEVRLHVPMHGFTESLNISNSLAICLHHLAAKLRRSEVAWHLSAPERLQLKILWSRSVVRRWLPHLDETFLEG